MTRPGFEQSSHMKTNHDIRNWFGDSDGVLRIESSVRLSGWSSFLRAQTFVLVVAAWCVLKCATPGIAATWEWNAAFIQDAYWSNPNNWSGPIPGGVPQNGDDLIFYDLVTVSGPLPMI